MNITGIIAEYNPFHNGHLYQIETTKKETNSDYIVVVMSGNFTQRGEAAIRNKFTRAQMALESGADLVLELPLTFATASAERFARGAVSLLHQTGIINTLSFGSEYGIISLLEDIALFLNNPSQNFNTCVKTYLKSGMSFPRARESALINEFGLNHPNINTENFLSAIRSPNNILGIEYIRAIHHFNSDILPFTTKRIKAGYHDLTIKTDIASATAIRSSFINGDLDSAISCMPTSSYDLFLNGQPCKPNMDLMMPFLHSRFMFSKQSDLYSIWDVPNDLINTFLKNYHNQFVFEDFVSLCTSKTYTSATVRRALLRIVLGISVDDIKKLDSLDLVPYIRILGCKKSSTILLNYLSQNSKKPMITNFKSSYDNLNDICKSFMTHDINATKLYSYLCGDSSQFNQDFTQGFLLV